MTKLQNLISKTRVFLTWRRKSQNQTKYIIKKLDKKLDADMEKIRARLIANNETIIFTLRNKKPLAAIYKKL